MLIRRSVLLWSFVLLWWAGLEAAPQRELFTLEQILSAPFPTGLVAAPRGGRVAWVFNATGERNIWVAEPPDYRGRAITSYQGDNGQEISDLEWTPDGSALAYVRGGRSNRQGEYPNPLSDPGGVEQAVWVISIEGGEPRKLDEGSSPSVSPKGDRVAFVKKSQIWWAPLDASKPASQLMHTRGAQWIPSLVFRWVPPGFREQPRRSQFRRCLPSGDEGAPLFGAQRGQRLEPRLVARRRPPRLPSSSRFTALRALRAPPHQ